MTIQSFKGSISRQTLRARKCPESLAELIRIVNFIPPEFKLPGIDEVIPEGTFSTDTSFQEIVKTLVEAWRRFLQLHFPSEQFAQLYRYLGPIQPHRLEAITNRYALLASAQTLLLAVANAHGRKIDVSSEAMGSISILTIDASGNLRLEPGLLLKIIEGVEAKRIRQCSECKRIFWAGRIDKLACNTKCLQRRRVRLWRERYLEKYKGQRCKRANDHESTRWSNHTTRRKTK